MAANAVFSALAHQILACDGAAASEYAELVIAREDSGRPIAGFDVTDFADTGIDIINPWK